MPKIFQFLIVLASTFGLFSNTAFAIAIETLVMPGQVIQGHADFEENCGSCHAKFSKSLQRDLCLTCHDHNSIARDIEDGTGLHGRVAQLRDTKCSSCHTEHEGRDADIVGLDRETFDHLPTDFPLISSHTTAECDECHKPGEKWPAAVSECLGCHQDDDQHRGGLGEDCSDCHKETIWQETNFDHNQETDYDLTGAHLNTICELCHVNQQYEDTPTGCYSCHQINDVHNGDNSSNCETCHKTTAWEESAFDHSMETGFALEGTHAQTACENCHTTSKFDNPLETECLACHRSDDDHSGLNGNECDKCHKPVRWTQSFFDHRMDTEFPLLGKHEEQVCQACHKGPIFDVPLEQTCAECHRRDDVHSGNQGEDCGQCHQESGWQDEVVFDHDFTSFPLIGLHAIVPCEACHLATGFQETDLLCVDCHKDEDPHEGGLGAECGTCHNPNDWQLWTFNHNERTEFILDGAHIDLSCRTCHRGNYEKQDQLSNRCSGCHRRDDIHNGQFGLDCVRCHTTDSFATGGRK